jgi:hypothetical protein
MIFGPCTKIISKCSKEINVRVDSLKIIRLLAENIGVSLHDIELDFDLLDMTRKLQAAK